MRAFQMLAGLEAMASRLAERGWLWTRANVAGSSRLAVSAAVLAASSLWLVVLSPSPAQAASRPVVFISTPGVSSAWPVSSAVAFMNRHTGSKLVRGRCEAWAPCVVITESAHLGILETSKDSYFKAQPAFTPKAPIAATTGRFTMGDLVRFAQGT